MSSQPETPKITLRLEIYGRVQGVYFRESMRIEAQNLAVAGWVRNRTDGSVEALLHGESVVIDTLVRWAHRGPELASVERVEIKPEEGRYTAFEVIR